MIVASSWQLAVSKGAARGYRLKANCGKLLQKSVTSGAKVFTLYTQSSFKPTSAVTPTSLVPNLDTGTPNLSSVFTHTQNSLFKVLGWLIYTHYTGPITTTK